MVNSDVLSKAQKLSALTQIDSSRKISVTLQKPDLKRDSREEFFLSLKGLTGKMCRLLLSIVWIGPKKNVDCVSLQRCEILNCKCAPGFEKCQPDCLCWSEWTNDFFCEKFLRERAVRVCIRTWVFQDLLDLPNSRPMDKFPVGVLFTT